MVALYVKGVATHALGVGEGGRVAEDEVPAVARTALVADPTHDVGLHVLVLGAGEAVALHVALRPVEVGARQVDGGGVLGAAVGRVAAGGAGVGEQIEEALGSLGGLGHLAHLGTHVAMVEEDARVEALGKVHLKDEATFINKVGAGSQGKAVRAATAAGTSSVAAGGRLGAFRAALGILRTALGAAANTQRDILGLHAEHGGGDGKHVKQATVGELEVDALGRGVLLHHEPAAVGVAAARGLTCLVEVDGHGVVGQVGVVDAVAGDVLAACPLGAQLGDLLQACGELVGGGHEHRDGRAVLEGDGGARRGAAGGAALRHALVVVAGGGGGCGHLVDAQRGLVAADERVVALGGRKAKRGVQAFAKADGGEPAALRQGVSQRRGATKRCHLAGEFLAAQPRQVANAQRSGSGDARERAVELGGGGRRLYLNGKAGGAKGAADGRGGAGSVVERDNAQLLGARGAGLGALVGLGHEPAPRFGVVAEPAVKAPARAQKARGAVERRTCRLNHELAGAAKGHGEYGGILAAAPVPSTGGQQGRSIVAAQAHKAVVGVAPGGAAVEERLAGKVDAAGGAASTHAHDDGEAGVAHVDAGAASLAVLEAVTDGVLGAQSHELGVPQLLVGTMGVDNKGLLDGEVLFPLDGVNAVVELIGIGGVDVGEDERHARGDAAPQTDAVGVGKRAGEGDLAVQGAHALRAQARKLAREQLLEPLGAGCEKLERACARRFARSRIGLLHVNHLSGHL